MGPSKKYATCIMACFTPFNFAHFVNLTLTLPLWYSLNFTEELWNEREDFLRVWLLQGITLQQRKWKTTSLDTIEFLDTHTHMLGIQPTLTNSGIILFLPKYYIIILDTLVDSLLEALFLLLDVMLSGLHGKPRRN